MALQDYYTILTSAGLAYEANRKALGLPIKLTEMSVGDGNGAIYNPAASQTALAREVWRGPINALLQDATNPTYLVGELTLPDDVGGWYVREVGFWTDSGILYAIGKYPESFKPELSAGAGKEFYIRAIFETSNAESVTLVVDDTVVKATRAYVIDYVAAELAKRDGKNSVRVATTGAIVLSGAQSIDGVAVVAGNRVLVKNQATGSQNGIYVVASGAWARAADADASIEVTPGLFVPVEEGTANGDSVWQLVTNSPITLGTTSLVFEMLFGRTGVVAGTYRSLTVDKYGKVIGGSNPVNSIAEGGTGSTTAAAALAALGAAPLAIAVPGVSVIDSATDLDSINQPGWFPALIGGAAGSRNPNHPDAQIALSAGNGAVNYYWVLVAKYSSNVIQVALPYLPGADTTIATIKFRMLGGGAWTPWRALTNSENLKEANQPEAEAAAITGKWMSPLRVLQLIRAAAASATETLRGALRIGTQPEVDAGTADDIVVTPKKLRWGFSSSFGVNNYVVFPTWLGGFILQWGTVEFTSVSTGTASMVVTYPLTWPTGERASFCEVVTNVPNTLRASFVPLSSSSFIMYLGCSSGTFASVPVRWFAAGK